MYACMYVCHNVCLYVCHNILPSLVHLQKCVFLQVFVDDIKLTDITMLASEILQLYESEQVVK